MKTAPFRYVRAETVEQALAALVSDEDARVLAGGQSLVPIMALRLSTPSVLVDITRCTELRSHGWDGPDLTVGAAVTDRVLERDPEVGRGHPLLARTLSLIAHPEIRARGTLCGSLAHADPAAELPALLLASDGHVLVRGPEGSRSIAAEQFFTGPFSPALQPGELVVGARVPAPRRTSGWSVEELSRRRGDFAIVGVVCVLDVGDDDRCSRARLSLFGVASTPVRARSAEQLLVGSDLQDDALDAAAAVCFDGVEVLGDEVHASAAYRRRAGTALVRRALGSAARLATGSRHD